ncbi:hypothetical protein II941_03610 [bacterium]|nr:hypothetical protein [bacterium]
MNIKQMLFAQLKQIIANYIYYYNNVRIQKKLNWCHPVHPNCKFKCNTCISRKLYKK